MKRTSTTLLALACLLSPAPALAAAGPAPGVAASPREVRPLLIGSEIPSGLSPMTAEGEVFDLEDALKEGPTVLILYRGGW